jgi:hypothetical protein
VTWPSLPHAVIGCLAQMHTAMRGARTGSGYVAALQHAPAPVLGSALQAGGLAGLASVQCEGGYVAVADVAGALELHLHRPPIVALLPFPVEQPPACHCWTADGRLLFVAAGTGVSVFHAAGGCEPLHTVSSYFAPMCMDATQLPAPLGTGGTQVPGCSAAGPRAVGAAEPAYMLACGGANGVQVHALGARSAPLTDALPVQLLQSYAITAVRFSASASLLAIAASDGHVGIWATSAFLPALRGVSGVGGASAPAASVRSYPALAHGVYRKSRVTDIAVSPDDTLLALASWDGLVIVYRRAAPGGIEAPPAGAPTTALAESASGAASRPGTHDSTATPLVGASAEWWPIAHLPPSGAATPPAAGAHAAALPLPASRDRATADPPAGSPPAPLAAPVAAVTGPTLVAWLPQPPGQASAVPQYLATACSVTQQVRLYRFPACAPGQAESSSVPVLEHAWTCAAAVSGLAVMAGLGNAHAEQEQASEPVPSSTFGLCALDAEANLLAVPMSWQHTPVPAGTAATPITPGPELTPAEQAWSLVYPTCLAAGRHVSISCAMRSRASRCECRTTRAGTAVGAPEAATH